MSVMQTNVFIFSLLSENCKMRQKAQSFYRIKNQEKGRDRKYRIGGGHIVTLV